MKDVQNTTMLDAALSYIKLGWSIIPIASTGEKVPLVKWKPYQKVLPLEFEIRSWWDDHPTANIAVITGELSGIFSVDFDSQEAIEGWVAKFGELPDGLRFRTGRGIQYIFRYDSYQGRNKAKILGAVDIRGEGGYFIAPPSIHKTGRVYEWEHIDPLIDGLDELDDCPNDMLSFIQEARLTPMSESANLFEGARTTEVTAAAPVGSGSEGIEWNLSEGINKVRPQAATKAGDWVLDAMFNGVNEGSRNATGARLCGWMVRRHADENRSKEEMAPLILQAMRTWNTRNSPPLEDSQIATICNSIINRHSFDALSDAINSPIYQMEIVYRYANRPLYNVYAEENKMMQCEMEDLLSIARFRVRYAELTKHVIPKIKGEQWLNFMKDCLSEATEIHEDLESSPVILMGRWIIAAAKLNTGEEAKVKLHKEPITLEDCYHITVEAAARFVEEKQLKGESFRCGKDWLEALGFKKRKTQLDLSPHVRGEQRKRVRTWVIKIDALKSIVYGRRVEFPPIK